MKRSITTITFEKPEILTESPIIEFHELLHITETRCSFSFAWEIKPKGENFTKEDLVIGLDAAKKSDASIVLLSFPSNYDNIKARLIDADFQLVGRLEDYYEEGVHEEHYVYRFNNESILQLESH